MFNEIEICPRCNHPVNKHEDFFCNEVGCLCNTGRDAAKALYERDVYKKLYEDTLQELEKYKHPTILVPESD